MKCALCKARFRKSKGGEKYVACTDCASQRVTDAIIRESLKRGAKASDLHEIRKRVPSEDRFQDAMCILLQLRSIAPAGPK